MIIGLLYQRLLQYLRCQAFPSSGGLRYPGWVVSSSQPLSNTTGTCQVWVGEKGLNVLVFSSEWFSDKESLRKTICERFSKDYGISEYRIAVVKGLLNYLYISFR